MATLGRWRYGTAHTFMPPRVNSLRHYDVELFSINTPRCRAQIIDVEDAVPSSWLDPASWRDALLLCKDYRSSRPGLFDFTRLTMWSLTTLPGHVKGDAGVPSTC